MPVSKEIEHFAEVMTSRLRELDEVLGTNDYLKWSSDDVTLRIQKLVDELPMQDTVTQKTMAVDLGNLAAILWGRL